MSVPRGLGRLIEFIEPERVSSSERWRRVRIRMTGEVFYVGVVRGQPVRLLYRPAGSVGFRWTAIVKDEQGRRVYSGPCFKSSGHAGTLWCAGLLRVPMFRQKSLDWFRANRPELPVFRGIE